MNDNKLDIVSTKLSVLIALSLRQLTGDNDFTGKTKRKQGVGDLARFLDDMGIESKDIAEILGAPISSVRTLLTPARRK